MPGRRPLRRRPRGRRPLRERISPEKTLDGTNLSDANLSEANLADAQISDADLWTRDLTGATLEGATISGTNLDGATLCGTIRTDGTNDDSSCPASSDTTDTTETTGTDTTGAQGAEVTSFTVGDLDCPSGGGDGSVGVSWATEAATAVRLEIDGVEARAPARADQPTSPSRATEQSTRSPSCRSATPEQARRLRDGVVRLSAPGLGPGAAARATRVAGPRRSRGARAARRARAPRTRDGRGARRRGSRSPPRGLRSRVRRRDLVDEGAIDRLDRVVDDEVLVLQPLDHRAEPGLAAHEMREDRVVLEPVVLGDDAAVAGAQNAPSAQSFWRRAISLSAERASPALSVPSRTSPRIPRRSASSVRSMSWTSTRC